MTELWQESATSLARKIAEREVTSTQVIDAHLARIAAVNPQVNAVVRVLAGPAREAAARADAEVEGGAALGPLHGVPFTVKENIDVAGLPTTWGVPLLAGAVPPLDAPVVERMRAAGAIPIARTNLPDMGLRIATESTLHGITRNPWNSERTAGGSSGGDAAALATGMTPIGLGNDFGGSLRNPANACGIASIKPSLGRVPHAGMVPVEDQMLATQMMLVQGPMARTVADLRLVLKVLIGAHPRDPLSVNAPFVGPSSARPLRIAVLPVPPGGSCDEAIAGVTRRAADALANAGYDVVEACPPRYEEALAAWSQLAAADMSSVLDRMLPLMGRDGQTVLKRMVRHAAAPDTLAGLSALMARHNAIARAWSLFMAEHPLLLTPTWTQLPFPHGFDAASDESAQATMTMARPVLPANLLGLPCACVPAGRDPATGLPIGVLLTGQRMREDLCLDAAEVVERQCGFTTPIDPR